MTNHPVIVLRPPERRGSQIALSADLLIGNDDSVCVTAMVGRETQAWLKHEGKRALDGLGLRLDRAKRVLSKYVRADGDWGKLGDLGALSFDMLREAVATGQLSGPSDDARGAASQYLALVGRMGPEAQEAAEADLEAMDAVAGHNPNAQRARHLLDIAHAMSNGSAPAGDDALDVCRALDSVAGGPCCDDCAAGKECAGTAPVRVDYGVEDAILLPDETPIRLARVSSDALGYRSYNRIAPKLSMQETARRVYDIVGQKALLPAVREGWGVPPIEHPGYRKMGVGPSPFRPGHRKMGVSPEPFRPDQLSGG